MRRTVGLSFLVDQETKDALQRAAAEEQQPVSLLVIDILTAWLRRRGYLPAS